MPLVSFPSTKTSPTSSLDRILARTVYFIYNLYPFALLYATHIPQLAGNVSRHFIRTGEKHLPAGRPLGEHQVSALVSADFYH